MRPTYAAYFGLPIPHADFMLSRLPKVYFASKFRLSPFNEISEQRCKSLVI